MVIARIVGNAEEINMIYVTCDNESCENFGTRMKLTDTDDRQEWKTETYECENCGSKKTHRTEYDQLGLVTKDEIEEE